MNDGLRLLAVDDELPALHDLARLLRSDPHVGEVHCATDGTEALRLLSERAFAGLFLDVRMPDIDGLALAARAASLRAAARGRVRERPR